MHVSDPLRLSVWGRVVMVCQLVRPERSFCGEASMERARKLVNTHTRIAMAVAMDVAVTGGEPP